MHSSRMRTICSLTVSHGICHGTHAPPPSMPPLPCMPLCHACPLPCMPPCHACLPAMHAPCHAHPSAMHAPAMHAPLPCMVPCHACPHHTHAPFPCHACPPLPCMPPHHARSPCHACPPPHMPHHHVCPFCGQTDTCENITFANFVCGQ